MLMSHFSKTFHEGLKLPSLLLGNGEEILRENSLLTSIASFDQQVEAQAGANTLPQQPAQRAFQSMRDRHILIGAHLAEAGGQQQLRQGGAGEAQLVR